MTIADVGRTRFVDGMRVAREHLDHLQDVLLQADAHGRHSAGLGKVCFGLRVQATGPEAVSVGPGAAFDRGARLLAIAEEQQLTLDWDTRMRMHLVLVHVLRADGVIDGVPTLLFDEAAIEARAASPPYEDDAVVFAQLDRGVETVEVTQRGAWYLPPLNHTHSGRFVSHDGLWRYDGHPLGFPPARFDSGFLDVVAGESVELTHGLGTTELLVQLQARSSDGVVTTAGLGQFYWYELDPAHVLLVRPAGEGGLEGGLQLRVMAWPLDPVAAGPLLPLADPGPDALVAPGEPFVLDATGSRAFGGHTLTKYIWTKTT